MPLTYRDARSSGTQFEVMSGALIVCTLWKGDSAVTEGPDQWRWVFHLGPGGAHMHGVAQTADDAKRLLEQQWRAWLQMIGLSDCEAAVWAGL